ncbi:hypothetical protein [Streptomyces sp. RFCAC02]|uniref:hypothetical protein n=1 Tax=Streptomyces sp. RFCAC02 TaxID=2499143 RepID=UPI001021873B|nr:hypothetical protein [Streptomyces sp. RFCAC02]
MDQPGTGDCPGPHRQCQACAGQCVEFRETLYVPASGRGQGLAAPHRCRHCRGGGHTCRAPVPCTPRHE